MNQHRIPVYRPDLSGNVKAYVNECIDSSWISSRGRFVGEFESAFAAYIGVEHAASVCNGTVALHLALLALGIGPGDEVIVPTLTYIAPVNAIAYTGATPVFVDSLRSSWQMDPEDVQRHITPRTRAILAVHLYGQTCDMAALAAIAREHRLFLVEDCAEAFGSTYAGRHAGTFGDIATFSFFGNKTITTGEGGMVVTNDKTLNERARHFKGQGLAAHREYWHDVVGYNYRMPSLNAALCMGQLETLAPKIAMKRALHARYRELFAGLNEAVLLTDAEGVESNYWLNALRFPDNATREAFLAEANVRGIQARACWQALPSLSIYRDAPRAAAGVGRAVDLAGRVANLPSSPQLLGPIGG